MPVNRDTSGITRVLHSFNLVKSEQDIVRNIKFPAQGRQGRWVISGKLNADQQPVHYYFFFFFSAVSCQFRKV
jgi:hypothetical protein